MNKVIPRCAFFLLLACSALPASAARNSGDAMSRTEERRQMTEDSSPRAAYSRMVKEANAAYAEAVRECGRMAAGQRASCMREAKTNLSGDLASARSQSSSGGSGLGSASGSGRGTTMQR